MNEHVINYCQDFITAKEKPEFAIFIKGPWGCGKTFFINSLIDSLDPTFVKERVLRISLYGITSIDEIDTKLFESLHPVLSSNGVKITGAVLRTLMKLGPSFALGKGDNSFSFSPDSISLPFIDNKKLEKDNKIILVDDFERASVASEAILGYFSNLISDSDNRVIFIGNEDKVKDKEEFIRIKEKTIGMEFSITPDFESALESFTDSIYDDAETKAIISDSMQSVNAILRCENLRIIRQSLYNFELFLHCISGNIKDNLSLLAKSFFVIYIQKSMDLIKRENTRDSLSAFFNLKSRFDDYVGKKKEHESDSYWSFLISVGYDSILPIALWESIIFDGQFIEDEINKSISEYLERTSQANLCPLFQLFSWFNMSSSDFESLFITVKNGFSNGEYTHPGEILIYTQLMFNLITRELIPMTISELEKEVRHLLNNNRVDPMLIEQWQVMISMNSFGGYGFSEIDEEWYVKLVDDIKKKSTSKSFDALKDEFEKEIEELSDIDLFCCNLQNKTGKEKYKDVAILSSLGEEELTSLFQKLIKLDSEDLKKIMYCLRNRYGFDSIKLVRVVLLDEYGNFIRLMELFANQLKDNHKIFNPKYYVLEYINRNLLELKQYLDEKKLLYENRLAENQRDYI